MILFYCFYIFLHVCTLFGPPLSSPLGMEVFNMTFNRSRQEPELGLDILDQLTKSS
jgi:hypothetical protein